MLCEATVVDAQIDVKYRFPIASLDSSGYIAIDDIACIGGTGERCRGNCVEGFRFCEQIHYLSLVFSEQNSLQYTEKDIHYAI